MKKQVKRLIRLLQRKQRPVHSGLLIKAFLALTVVVLFSSLASSVMSSSPPIEAMRAALEEVTDVPVVLPDNPADNATILNSSPEAYLVAFTPEECTADEADCVTASMLGRALITAHPRMGGEVITLDNGTQASYFSFDPTEPSNAFLYWVVGEYRYELSMLNATKEKMLEVANSAYAE